MVIRCEFCKGDNEVDENNHYCKYCHANLYAFKDRGFISIWIYTILAAFFFVLANVKYMMIIKQPFGDYYSTIVGGIIELYKEGSFLVATIVLLASVVIPSFKIVSLFLLLLIKDSETILTFEKKEILYKFLNIVGRWSMVDIIVIGVLAAVINFANLLVIAPGGAAIYFLLTLICNIIAVKRLDINLFRSRMKYEKWKYK